MHLCGMCVYFSVYLYVYCVSMCVYFLCICISHVYVCICAFDVCVFSCVCICVCVLAVFVCLMCVCLCVLCVCVCLFIFPHSANAWSPFLFSCGAGWFSEREPVELLSEMRCYTLLSAFCPGLELYS